jgi:hypothetical protein
MPRATESPITIHRLPETEVEIPQSPRFAIQRLTEDGWETLTYGTCGDEEPERSPYYGEPLIYHTRYVAEHIAKAYPGMTIRVHELPKIITKFEYPPIPDRRFDWSAVTEDYDLGSPVGHGATKAKAEADLLEQLEALS